MLLVACEQNLVPSYSTSFSSSEDLLVYSSSAHSVNSVSVDSILGDTVDIDFYNLNDFHGAVEHNVDNKELGINRLASFFKSRILANPNTVLTSSGDMWQGSADSNITRGRLVVDAMNMSGFAGMAIGNHEFDWTDTVIHSNRIRSEFPLLGINIFDKRTTLRASFAEPYTMIQRGGVRIGLIGTIGASLESSILQSAVANYNFVPYTDLVISAAEYLRSQGAKIVILLNHDGQVEQGVLPYVDGVFNGHTHLIRTDHIQFVEGNVTKQRPVYQASANGKAIAHFKFRYDVNLDSVEFLREESGVITYDNLVSSGEFPIEDPDMKVMYDQYLVDEINAIKNEVIGVANGTFTRAKLGLLAVDEMLEFGRSVSSQVVASFHNSGGVRDTISSGDVTYGALYKAFPFDNELIIVRVTGTQLSWWLSQNLVMKTIANLGTVQANATYAIITINYLIEKNYEDSFMYPHDVFTPNNTFQYVRERLRLRWIEKGTINASSY
jgi:2',3'-cyclic-nucleotide 2'-phosphodiesterase (5'-nucleotidase family)